MPWSSVPAEQLQISEESRSVKMGRMTWGGFGIALIGWVLLIVDLVASDTLMRAGNLVAVLSLRSDVVTLAQTIILTGFGIAIMGTLRAGFGAFTKFFDAVLQRSASPRPKSPSTLEPEPIAPEPAHTPEPATSRAPEIITVTPSTARPERSTPERAKSVRAKDAKDRNYVILSDGSVEVETMFGTRIFANLTEAKDFIR